MDQKRVLLVGARKSILKKLAEALVDEKFSVEWTNKYKKVIDDFWKSDFDLIAFGRGVPEIEKDKIKGVFSTKNSKIVFVEGMAPIIPLLAYQVKAGLNKDYKGQTLSGFKMEEEGDELKINFEFASKIHVKIIQYHLDFFFRTHIYYFLDSELNKGPYAITVMKKKVRSFLVVDVGGREIFIKAI